MQRYELNHRLISFSGIREYAGPKAWVFRVDPVTAVNLTQTLAGRPFDNLAHVGDIVILSRYGMFIKHVPGGFLVTVPHCDLDVQFGLPFNAQCESEKRQWPFEIGNGPFNNPLPQVLKITSYGTRLDGRWGITGTIDGLRPEDVVSQIKFHQERQTTFKIEGFSA